MRGQTRRVAAGAVAALALLTAPACRRAAGPAGSPADRFTVRDEMIPARDGIRLHTKIFVPKDRPGPLPFILLRTPYGIEGSAGQFRTYLKALAVGVLNTIKVAFVGIVLTVILGTFLGVARLSTNWLVAKLAAVYIEVMQDIPILLQLFFWYSFFNEILPPPRDAIEPITGVFMSNRGIVFAVPEWHAAFEYAVMAFVAACIASYFIHRWAKKRQEKTGRIFPVVSVSLGIVIGLPLVTWLLAGAPHKMSVPELVGFNFQGGLNMSPEFGALLLGLVIYTAAFVAEIVRAGIQAIGKGQTEAAMALGLKPGQILNLVILPQALRVIIPPLTSQMLNLTKNSSLAVAIGFPDFVSVASTTINQTGQAIEGISLIMIVYLCFSLLTSLFMNWYNKKMALVER